MYLMHVGDEPITENIPDIGFVTFLPGEATEVEDDFAGERLIERKRIQGFVEVPTIKSRRGIEFDLDTAEKLARAALLKGKKMLVDNYIAEQRGRIQANFAALPPSPVVKKIIEEQGIDLKAYGITPAGVKIESEPGQRISALENMVAEVVAENRKLHEENKAMLQQVHALLSSEKGDKKKGS